MKSKLLIVALIATFLTSCQMSNPLLEESKLPYGAPAFDKIKTEHYKPAIIKSIELAKADIEAICNNTEEPTFKNTIEALEYSGADLSRVTGIFYNLLEANTNAEMQQIAEDVTPIMTEYSMSIILNEKLFERIKTVYNQKDKLNLNKEQAKLLDDTYKSFARNGANLKGEAKEEFSKVSENLSLLGLKFGNNVLAATNAFTLNVTDESRLQGLPPFVKQMGAAEAKSRNLEGWVFTLQYPSFGPFMKYCADRDLREQMWKGYATKCITGENDNSQVLKDIVSNRLRMAQLLGYDNYAEYALESRMAKTPENVEDFLNDLLEKSIKYAKNDVKVLEKYAKEKGLKEKFMPWDFTYYSAMYKKEKYSLNDELVKPYLQLESVSEAVFGLATKLYGLKFVENKNLPKYHPDVIVYEVYDENDRFMSLFYMDFFPRESKSGGAWMTAFREQSIKDGVEHRPQISVVTNFTKPTETDPSLLTFGELVTFLHEFGHALHGMLAEGTYTSLTGTSVARDFVELPSQIMENWAYEKEFLTSFAKHYQTGESMPEEIIDNIVKSKNYNAGYDNVRQLSFAIGDMAWHVLEALPADLDVEKFEKNATKSCQVMPSVKGAIMANSFTHIFGGGYAAGYYSYKWAEVLEADAFALFKEKGIFNKEVANSFRENILSKGGLEDADILFRNFRGRDPEPEALLIKLGLMK